MLGVNSQRGHFERQGLFERTDQQLAEVAGNEVKTTQVQLPLLSLSIVRQLHVWRLSPKSAAENMCSFIPPTCRFGADRSLAGTWQTSLIINRDGDITAATPFITYFNTTLGRNTT
jgi:hypothetical protein